MNPHNTHQNAINTSPSEMPGRLRVANTYVGKKRDPQPAAKMDNKTLVLIVLAT